MWYNNMSQSEFCRSNEVDNLMWVALDKIVLIVR